MAGPGDWKEADDPRAAVVFQSAGARPARERALVLTSVGVAHRLVRSGRAHLLIVPAEDEERALGELARYERENRDWPPPEERFEPAARGLWGAAGYALMLGTVFMLQSGRALDADWVARGGARAGAIRGGEWWRCLTALTLHTDAAHLLGNVFFGALFGSLLAQLVGNGRAWLGMLVAGAVGNGLNALVQKPDHGSIGASTAVFGVLGLLMTCEWGRRQRLRNRALRRWAPLFGGAALLGFLGASGERTDVAAHVAGMLAGLALGLLMIPGRRSAPGPVLELVLVALAPLALVAAWALALA